MTQVSRYMVEFDYVFTRKYPNAHPLTTIASALVTRALPYTWPITLGTVEKNPPLPAPLRIVNTMKGARLDEAGQIASVLIALSANARQSDVTGPIVSHSRPNPIRPAAEDRLKTASKSEARNVDVCSDAA